MSRSGRFLFVASLLGLFVSSALLVVVLGYLALVVYLALRTGTPIVEILLDLAVPYVPIVGILVVAVVISAVGFGWGLLQRASIPRSARLQSAFERIERRYAPIRALGLSDIVAPPEPTPEEALANLKRQYVTGEIDERTFERKLDRLVRNDTVDDARAARERESTLER